MMTARELSQYFDHTLLNPAATLNDVKQICREALEYEFCSVCVNPVHVAFAARELAGSNVKVCSVIGFPLGAGTSFIKAAETKQAVDDGAREIDMVINVGALKDGNLNFVEKDIRAVVDAAGGNSVKVIIETCLLNEDEKITACRLSEKAGAAFVKTSTGFADGGATAEDVALMKKNIGKTMKIKASGGIKTGEDALAMIKAGAGRIGSSACVAIVKDMP